MYWRLTAPSTAQGHLRTFDCEEKEEEEEDKVERTRTTTQQRTFYGVNYPSRRGDEWGTLSTLQPRASSWDQLTSQQEALRQSDRSVSYNGPASSRKLHSFPFPAVVGSFHQSLLTPRSPDTLLLSSCFKSRSIAAAVVVRWVRASACWPSELFINVRGWGFDPRLGWWRFTSNNML